MNSWVLRCFALPVEGVVLFFDCSVGGKSRFLKSSNVYVELGQLMVDDAVFLASVIRDGSSSSPGVIVRTFQDAKRRRCVMSGA